MGREVLGQTVIFYEVSFGFLVAGSLLEAVFYALLLVRITGEQRTGHRNWIAVGLASIVCALFGNALEIHSYFVLRSISGVENAIARTMVSIGEVGGIVSTVLLVRRLLIDPAFQQALPDSGRD